ncbi:hypothetical protein LBMAG56_24450 [Verrucomicrobiota bacterium]|nr:hypothetical protein LBMAG56_24450 [Verrucomicrobiota bacterium]
MKISQLFGIGIVAFSFFVNQVPAQKRPDVSEFPFWPGKGGVVGGQYVPGLTAALLLTDEQQDKLNEARQETIYDPALNEQTRRLKGDPNLPEAERDAIRKRAEDAREALKARVNSILMVEQKEFIAKAATERDAAAATVRERMQDKFAAAKGKGESALVQREYQEAVAAEFVRRLEAIMTPVQQAAMRRRAELELERKRQAEAAPKKGAK